MIIAVAINRGTRDPGAAAPLVATETPSPSASAPDRPFEATLDVTKMRDGPLTRMDTGHKITNFGRQQGVVSRGSWTHPPLVSNHVAGGSYAQIELPGDVTRIGLTVRFAKTRQAAGGVALVVPSKSWATTTDWLAGIHFVVDGQGAWNVTQYASGKTGPTYVHGKLPDLRDGAAKRFELRIDHDPGNVTVMLPDGTSRSAASSLIRSGTSEYAIFEIYDKTTDTKPAEILNMSASSS